MASRFPSQTFSLRHYLALGSITVINTAFVCAIKKQFQTQAHDKITVLQQHLHKTLKEETGNFVKFATLYVNCSENLYQCYDYSYNSCVLDDSKAPRKAFPPAPRLQELYEECIAVNNANINYSPPISLQNQRTEWLNILSEILRLRQQANYCSLQKRGFPLELELDIYDLKDESDIPLEVDNILKIVKQILNTAEELSEENVSIINAKIAKAQIENKPDEARELSDQLTQIRTTLISQLETYRTPRRKLIKNISHVLINLDRYLVNPGYTDLSQPLAPKPMYSLLSVSMMVTALSSALIWKATMTSSLTMWSLKWNLLMTIHWLFVVEMSGSALLGPKNLWILDNK